MVVFLDPIETGGWLGVLRANGVEEGLRFRAVSSVEDTSASHNIVWWNGNDFQTWRNPSDDAVVLAVARGIRSVDHVHLQTVLLDYLHSGSLDDSRWRPLIQLDAAYTYLPTYAEVLKEYNRREPHAGLHGRGGIRVRAEHKRHLARYARVPATAGVLEHPGRRVRAVLREPLHVAICRGWKQHLDTPGSAQVRHLARLFNGLPWFRLVPDQGHRVVTSGYGTFQTEGNVASSSYVTTAATPDGTLAISYLPAGGAITVDMSRLGGSANARWYDPSKGTYSVVSGSPFRTSGSLRISAPGANGDGDPDWVLVLQAK